VNAIAIAVLQISIQSAIANYQAMRTRETQDL